MAKGVVSGEEVGSGEWGRGWRLTGALRCPGRLLLGGDELEAVAKGEPARETEEGR